MKRISNDVFDKTCSELIDKVNTRIHSLLNDKQPASLYEPCSYVLEGNGKRLRPLLVLFSSKAVGNKYKTVFNAAAAVELLHNFTLVHDDIMDNASKRRSKETIHVKYDLSTAILTGDNLVALAYSSLMKDFRKNDSEVLNVFTKGIIEVCEGQSLDKEFEIREEVTIPEYLIMIEKKTAALMKMCCSIGARLGGGSKKQIKALEEYGRNLGIAFQIQDDLLDIIAEEKQLGKVTGSDLIEGKKTFLLLRALEKATEEDLTNLKKLISEKGIKKEEVGKYKEIYCRLGVVDEAKFEIEKYTILALENLRKIESKHGNELLTLLAESLIKRNR